MAATLTFKAGTTLVSAWELRGMDTVRLGSADAILVAIVQAGEDTMSMRKGEVAVEYSVAGEGPFFHTFAPGARVERVNL